MPKVLILLSSPDDLAITGKGQNLLHDFGVSFHVRIASAHQAPAFAGEMIQEFVQQGGTYILCVAPFADHLAALASSLCLLPVLAVPLQEGSVSPFSAGVPVAVMPAGEPGVLNALLFILQTFAIHDRTLQQELHRYRHSLAAQLIAVDNQHRITFDG